MVSSERYIEYRARVRSFMDDVVRPVVAEYDFGRPLTRVEVGELHERFAHHDIAVTTPLLENGAPDLVAFGIFAEELARVECSLADIMPAVFFSNVPMRELLNDEQAELYGHFFDPGSVFAVAITEPGAGSNPSQLTSVAVPHDDGWMINGRKRWIGNASISDAILVTCRLGADSDATSMFMVTRADYDYDAREIPCLGLTGVGVCEIDFTDCFVPRIAQIGGPGEGVPRALGVINRARLNLAFKAVGIAQAALDLATQHAKDRHQFGRPIGSFQLVQELLADMAIDIEAGRLLALNAASIVQSGQRARTEVSIAKAFCTEMAVRAASNGIQVHGATGLSKECRAEQFWRDARMLTIPDGTTQIHKLVIGRELLGISAITG